VIWRSKAMILVAFLFAGFAVWIVPGLLARAGLGDFGFLGQIMFGIAILSLLEAVFTRLDRATGPADHSPPDR
jgi:hypothetical protein